MQRPQTILVAIDFSPCSRTALKQAARISRWAGGTLHVAHVIVPGVIDDIAEATERDQAHTETRIVSGAKADLERFAEESGAVNATIHIAVGRAFERIQDLAQESHAELVVLGVTGAGERGVGAGTLATQAVRKLTAPVLLVDESHEGQFQRIIVGVDFSDTARRALEAGAMIAACDESELHALHVYDAPWHHFHYRSQSDKSSPQFREQFIQRLRGRLEQFTEPVRKDLAGDRLQLDLSEYQSHGFGIVDYATKHDADLVVLGTQGHSFLHAFFIGSTAERVLRETICSVLAVKPAEA